MAILDLFLKRVKAQGGELPDVYQYAEIPQFLRMQVVHIVRDALGDASAYESKTTEFLKLIHDTLCREYGVFALMQDARPKHRGSDYASDVYNHLYE